MAKLTGTNPDQVPTNADLGDMAYKDGGNFTAGPLTITDGKVGVNNTAPTSPLHVEGTIQSRLGASGIQIYGTGGSGEVASVGSLPLVFNVNASPKMTILSSGNVGIGTSTPNHLLDIETNGGGGGVSTRIYNTGTTVSDSAFLYLRTGSSTAANGIVFGDGANPIAGSINYFHNGDSLQVVVNAAERMRIRSNGELDIASGLLELNGNDIGGTQVTIADDAAASITPPRKGGFMFVTASGNTDFPQQYLSSYFSYDVGSSLNAEEFLSRGSIAVSTSDVTGTTGTDGSLTVAVQTGVIKIENRSGSSYSFQITFL